MNPARHPLDRFTQSTAAQVVAFGWGLAEATVSYAEEWGARRGSLLAFLAGSIPARGIRFLLAMLPAATISRLIARWSREQVRTEMMVLSAFWIAFYSF